METYVGSIIKAGSFLPEFSTAYDAESPREAYEEMLKEEEAVRDWEDGKIPRGEYDFVMSQVISPERYEKEV